MTDKFNNGKKGERPATEVADKPDIQRQEAIVGILKKVADFGKKAFCLPVFAYVGILVVAPLVAALVSGLAYVLPSQAVSIIAVLFFALFFVVVLYACIGTLLSVLKATFKSRSFNDVLYEFVYSPSYLAHLIAVAVMFAVVGIGGGVLSTWLTSAVPVDGSIYAIIQLYIGEFALIFVAVLFGKLLFMPLKLILTATRWCPNCGKFFALGFISDRTMLGAEEAAIAQYSQSGRKYHTKGVREYHQKAWTCKYCGGQVSKTYTKEYA